jgi:hypothetical protein
MMTRVDEALVDSSFCPLIKQGNIFNYFLIGFFFLRNFLLCNFGFWLMIFFIGIQAKKSCFKNICNYDKPKCYPLHYNI